MNGTITITFGDNVENHVGNQQIGKIAESGISIGTIKKIQNELGKKYTCKFINLESMLDDVNKSEHTGAGILIVKKFVNLFFGSDDEDEKMYNKFLELDWDKKALMKGRVVNKKARYNLCFSDFEQEPDYEKGKGRVYDFKNLKKMRKIRKFLKSLIGEKLNAEGNYYYNTDDCYIGYHGDTERRIVVGIRFGEQFPLYFKWFKNGVPITKAHKINLDSGDLYIMSEKAVGFDWKKRTIPTLRHAAGFTPEKK